MKVIKNLKVPESWEDVSFGTYMRLMNAPLDYTNESKVVTLESNIEVMATLIGVSIQTIERLSVNDFNKISSTIKFLEEEIPHTYKTKWKFIHIKDLKMDKWLAYEKLKTDIGTTLPKILTLLQETYTEQQIKEMPATEVLRAFFTLEKKLKKYIKYFQLSLVMKMVIWRMKFLWRTKILRKPMLQ